MELKSWAAKVRPGIIRVDVNSTRLLRLHEKGGNQQLHCVSRLEINADVVV